MIVSTTPHLEGWQVTKYLGPVSSHVVAGTNIFSDIAASFSDVFGGQSKSYQKQLERIKSEVIGQLKDEAAERGADALVGLRIDHDQISGQNKAMFMVTASATAVRADATSEGSNSSSQRQEPSGPYPARELEVEVRKEELLNRHEEGEDIFTEENWKFLIENGIPDFAGPVRSTATELKAGKRGNLPREKEYLSRARDYFLSIPDTAKEHLYEMASHGDQGPVNWAVDMLEEGNMLDLSRVESMLDGDFHSEQKPALEILKRVDKPYYEKKDLERLERTRRKINEGFGKRGEVKEVETSGMLSSGMEKVWQIEDGPENPMDNEYCSGTGLDIYGFREGETRPSEVASVLDRKIKVLRRRFSE